MTTEEKREEAMELAQLLLHTSSLDDLVHDCKGHEAAAINNSGAEEQLEYLMEFYWLDSLTLLADLEKLFVEQQAGEKGDMK